ncbi:hypothetical protein [Sphingomonas sp. DT-204]|uniref:hypothetical protein n=1 Tax=Sphingomonas sp. DT-204 TaxID=3396166 RepID=UPI003F1E25DE
MILLALLAGEAGPSPLDPHARVAKLVVRRAACGGEGCATGFDREATSGYGASGDATLRWQVAPDGARSFIAELWTGRGDEAVIDDCIAAPPK